MAQTKSKIEIVTRRNPAEVLKELRIKNNYSLRQLSREIGIPNSNISRIEQGHTAAPLSVLQKYHAYFGVSYEYLLGETEEYTNADCGAPTYEDNTDYQLRRYRQYKKYNLEYQTLRFLLTVPAGRVFLRELSAVMWNKSAIEEPDEITLSCQKFFKRKSKQNGNKMRLFRMMEIATTTDMKTHTEDEIQVIINHILEKEG